MVSPALTCGVALLNSCRNASLCTRCKNEALSGNGGPLGTASATVSITPETLGAHWARIVIVATAPAGNTGLEQVTEPLVLIGGPMQTTRAASDDAVEDTLKNSTPSGRKSLTVIGPVLPVLVAVIV